MLCQHVLQRLIDRVVMFQQHRVSSSFLVCISPKNSFPRSGSAHKICKFGKSHFNDSATQGDCDKQFVVCNQEVPREELIVLCNTGLPGNAQDEAGNSAAKHSRAVPSAKPRRIGFEGFRRVSLDAGKKTQFAPAPSRVEKPPRSVS